MTSYLTLLPPKYAERLERLLIAEADGSVTFHFSKGSIKKAEWRDVDTP